MITTTFVEYLKRKLAYLQKNIDNSKDKFDNILLTYRYIAHFTLFFFQIFSKIIIADPIAKRKKILYNNAGKGYNYFTFR